ncbi:tetratricopeptide repeat protein [Microbacterium oleivorans]|uniref:Putative ATPase n=1 Tax=Microbacterium oleivorans TaxID=273677 RepID=A0A031FTT6_9MICO|nr:tetratricopeptide repeat protein [Microbacterium oleivorans]EZP28023.1 putative ATPase [Microbacterium oleivorans]
MTGFATRIRSLFDEIDNTPWGPQEQALVAQAVALAQESGDERLEYEARLRQTSSANMGGDTDLMLTSFAWCLAHHDADPQRFPAEIDRAGDVLWQYKWMASALGGSPEFPSEQIAAVLDDMEAHYRRAGVGPSGVLMARFEDAWAAGRMDEATDLQRTLEATPRDDYSHCDACVRSQFAGFFIETGREDEAIRLVDEMIENGFSCGEEPEHALSRILLPYLRAGMLDEARTAHLRSYRLAKDNPDNLAIVAKNIVFCVVTGNEARALALVERHLPWIVHDGLNADAHATALGAFALALDAVAAAGHPELTVRGSDAEALVPVFGEHEGAWRVDDLAAAAWAAAGSIAAAFDRRNGTDAHTRNLERLRDTGAERYDVPIRSHDFSTAVPATPAVTREERLDRAVALAQAGSIAAIEPIRELLTDASPDERVTLSAHLLGGLVAVERTDEAEAFLPERFAALRAAGHVEQADLEERLGLVLFGKDLATAGDALRAEVAAAESAPAEVRADLIATLAVARMYEGAFAEAREDAREGARLFAEAGDATRSQGVRLLEVEAAASASQTDEARALVADLLAEPISDGRRARALAARARLHGAAEEFAEGAADADETVRLLLTLGADDLRVGEAFVLAGALHEDAGSGALAAGRYRSAVERFESAGAPTADARYRLGRAMITSGMPQEAVDALHEVLQEETAAEVPAGSRAITVGLLARAYEGADDYGNAVGAWGFAADLHEEAGEVDGQAHALVQQGRHLGNFGEFDDAVTAVDTAIGLIRGQEEQVGLQAEALHLLAQAKMQRGDEDAFDVIDEALALGRANEAHWYVADVTDTRARLLAARGRTDEAVATALQAADGFAAAGDAGSGAGSELLAARLLVGAERSADAVALYRSTLDHAAENEQLRQQAALELGDVYESLGRHAEAAEVRSTLPA